MNDPDAILKKHWLKEDSVQVGNIIASGAYGRVYHGWYGNLRVAIKDYGVVYDELDRDDRIDIMEEFQLMKDLNHTNTVRVYPRTPRNPKKSLGTQRKPLKSIRSLKKPLKNP